MTTFSNFLAPQMNSNAEFQTLVTGILAGIDAILTRTSDTGQINGATVVRPSAGSSAGYAMWRITGGTQDVYMKMEFGSAALTTPQIWMTFGTVTDGAGTLSASMTARRAFAFAATSATAYDCHFSGGTGRFAMSLFSNNANTQDRHQFSMERDWDSSGTAVEDYFFAVYSFGNNGNVKFNRCIKVVDDVWAEHNSLPGAWPSETGSKVLSGNVCSYPIRPRYGPERCPSQNWIVIASADAVYGATFTANMYGASKTWIRLNVNASAGTGNDTNNVMCMRWD